MWLYLQINAELKRELKTAVQDGSTKALVIITAFTLTKSVKTLLKTVP